MESYDKILNIWKGDHGIFHNLEDIDYILMNFKVLFAYHSGRIENIELTYELTLEIFEGKPILNFSGEYRTIYEVVNQKDCYQMLLGAILEKRPISVPFIKQIHYELAKHTYDDIRVKKGELPGEFKKGYYAVGEYQVGVEPERVEEFLQDLIDEVNDTNGANWLKAAAYFHLVFERIHPFADANGRVGRTLLNYYLMTHDHPPIVIREYNRKDYVNAFDQFHYEAKLEPMMEYLRKETVETWKHLIPELRISPKRKSLSELEAEFKQQQVSRKGKNSPDLER